MNQIILRAPTGNDANTLIALNSQNQPFHHPWATPFTDIAGFETWIGRIAVGDLIPFLIVERATDQIAGIVNLGNPIRGAFQNAFLGYYGMADHAGRGLMTEGVKAVIRHAFQDLKLHRLEANIQPGNTRSVALVRRLGFRLEGFSPAYLHIAGAWRDHERWAIRSEEFPAS